MGRKKFGKRKFTGNIHTRKNEVISNLNSNGSVSNVFSVEEVRFDRTPCEEITNKCVTPPSSSKKKLSSSKKLFDEMCGMQQSNICEDNMLKSGYVLVDLELMSKALSQQTKCKYCESDSLSIQEDTKKRKGLSTSLVIVCAVCRKEGSFQTSKFTPSGYEVNTRFIYGLRCIGKGYAAGRLLCAMMNLPKPHSKFHKVIEYIHESADSVSKDSMLEACKEAVQCNDDDDKIPVAIDGTWHKRGHTSNHGVVVATSVDTGRVLDSELLSKYCHTCIKLGAHEGCVKNFDGSSGGMEAEGAVRIFQRSNQTRGVKYKQYLGDGDSKGFVKVLESKPYGDDFTVEKLECIGHVQKRMGSRLRKLKKDLVGKKLSDGKGVGGSKRLTDGMIDKLQSYYGQAIRNNLGSLQDMRNAVWATYFHELSTDDHPQHGLCPKGDNSWCKYNRKESDYKHHGLPESVMLAIKPIYRDLSHPKLLKKCLHRKTQNINEEFNYVLWCRIPKTVFVSVNTLRLGLTDAIISFNDGNIGRVKVLQKLGIEPGFNTITILKELDSLRINKAEMVVEEMAKKERKLKRNKKRSHEDTEDPDYGAGMF